MFTTPDAGPGIMSYGVTLVLLGAGAEDRAQDRPWLPLLAAGKVAIAAVASWVSLPLVLPEARRAWRSWRSPR